MYDFHRLCCSPPPLFGNATLCCLSSMYALQNNEDVRQENLPMFISLTIFWRVRTPFTFNWLRERCQSSSVSSSVGDCTKLVAFASYIFTKSILYKLRSHGAIAMASLLQYLTIHLFRLNWTFKLFDTSCSLRANWHAICVREAHLYYEFGDFTFKDCFYKNRYHFDNLDNAIVTNIYIL